MVLQFHESIKSPRIVLTSTHTLLWSHILDLITSKVRYCLSITAEVFTSRLRSSVMHARYADSTNQSSADQSSHQKFGRTKHRIVTAGIRAHAWHVTLTTRHGISKHRSSAEIADRCIAIGNSTHFICIKDSQSCLWHIIPHNYSEMHRIVAIAIITHYTLQPLGTDICQIGCLRIHDSLRG